MRVRQEWALVSACSVRKGKKSHFLTSWGWVSCTCSHVSVRRQSVYILYTEEYILHVNGVCMTPYLSVLWWFSDFMCMKNKIQPLCSSPRHFSPTWHAQVCHNPLQKDVSTQVWQATANTNMMFDKQFYKQVLAKLQWTNSSNRFSPGNLQAVTRFRSHLKPFLQISQNLLCPQKDSFHTPETLTSPSVLVNWQLRVRL